ncbi:hypothetical protein EBR37_02705 [bacterium]|nr:hypothetical protein [bacterium]
MSVVENIPEKIIGSCSEESLYLAEKIYNKAQYDNIGMRLAAIYIASCLFSGNRNTIHYIEDLDIQTSSLVYFILQSRDCRILKKIKIGKRI